MCSSLPSSLTARRRSVVADEGAAARHQRERAVERGARTLRTGPGVSAVGVGLAKASCVEAVVAAGILALRGDAGGVVESPAAHLAGGAIGEIVAFELGAGIRAGAAVSREALRRGLLETARLV